MYNYELSHHGIKGMKWGVRRTPEQLGRVAVAKGSYVQSMSKDTARKAKGNIYVSYTDKDNIFYENTMPEYYTRKGGKATYKNTYKVKKDIVVPDDVTAMKEFASMYKDNKVRINKLLDAIVGKDYMNNLRCRLNDGTATQDDAKNFRMLAFQAMYYDDVVKTAYFKRLRKAGYNAVRDYQDYNYSKSWSGVQVDDPLIIFDSAKLMKLHTTTVV